MTPLRPEDIQERLREGESPVPPADLLARLRAEIPDRPVVVELRGESGSQEERSATRPDRRRGWLLAASVAVALVGGSLAWRVVRQMERATSPAGAEQVLEGEASRQDLADDLGPAAKAGKPEQLVPAPEAVPERPMAGDRRDPFTGLMSAPAAPLAGPTPETRDRAEAAAEAAAEEYARTGRLRLELRDVEPPEDQLLAPRKAVPDAARPAAPALMLRESSEYRAQPSDVPYSAAPPSTGGTTEPNDAPYGDMFFRSYGVNPFIDTEDDNLSTFGLDVDTGAYTLARGYIERGHLPPPEAVRVEELVNFFDYGDPAPSAGDFAVTLEGAPTPFAEGERYRLLRAAIRGRDVTAADRKPATLVFVVDVSGSMERENRLGLVQRSLGLLLDELRRDDRVGLVVYGDRGRVLLEPNGDLEAIRSAIDRLAAGGSTNAEEGLALGYELAERYFRAGAINRVILCSDGVANVGRTGPDSILARIGAAAERGIELTTVGFGMGNYNDLLMEQLADRGDGSYAYVDALDEARRVFVEELTGTLQTIAREARVQVEFDPRTVSRYRLLGYENRDIADGRFRDDSVDAGEIGAGHSVTALYEIKLAEAARPDDVLATVRLRYRSVATGEMVETAAGLRLGDLAASWESASPALRLASLVAEHAEILRRSYWARQGDLEDVFRRAQSVSGEFPGDVEVAELVGLIGRAARLEGERTESLAFDDR